MTDVWETVVKLDDDMQSRLADVLEIRGADARQQEMRRLFLGDVEFPPLARVLDLGCGTGVLTRAIGRIPAVAAVVGIDNAPLLLERARALAADLPNVDFQVADVRTLPLASEGFDVVVFDSVLSHMSAPEPALLEALRVLRPEGRLAIFDGDYATTTVALAPDDPLQVCVNATLAESVNDRWLIRRLGVILRDCGFEPGTLRSHGFVEGVDGGYMLTVVERGVDILRTSGRIGDQLAAALRAEARRRVVSGEFFGHIAYASVVARRSPTASRVLEDGSPHVARRLDHD